MRNDEDNGIVFGEVCEAMPHFKPKEKSVITDRIENSVAQIELTKQLHERLFSLEGKVGLLSQAHNKSAVKIYGLENKLANESI
jgi:hypothetical protein